jgi:hypothetical protein
VSKKIFEKYRLSTYAEAGFKPFVIAAIVFLTRIEKPFDTLGKLLNKKCRR